MARIGKVNQLRVVKEVDFGIYLDGDEDGEILMPTRYVPKDCKVDDVIDCFVYLDSEDRLLATTETPYVTIGEFACLKVIDINSIGAFLDWGLPKDLFVPFSEQSQKMITGRSYVVYVYLDDRTERIVASSKIDNFLGVQAMNYHEGKEVDLLILNQTDLGYNAIINNAHKGILYQNEVFQPLHKGQRLKGYIKKIREDQKIDLTLQKRGQNNVNDTGKQILDRLKENDGFMNLTDKSPADVIYKIFGVSKKNFKMAIGSLYKAKIITLEENGIRLISKKEKNGRKKSE